MLSGVSTLSVSSNGTLLLLPYTLLELAYTKCFTPYLCESPIMLANPTMFDCIYADGFSNEYLTPACAARLHTLSNFSDAKTASSEVLSSREHFTNLKLPYEELWSITFSCTHSRVMPSSANLPNLRSVV